MDKVKALDILNREKDYEDHLAESLSKYFLGRLRYIDGLTEDEEVKIHKYLQILITDSRRHSDMFNRLVQLVFESEKEKF